MNTGVQRSGATPPAARTATTPRSAPNRATPSARARTSRSSPWRTRSRTWPPPRWPTCATWSTRRPGRWTSTGPATCTSWCRARSAGAARPPTRSRSPGSLSSPALFPVFEAEAGEVVSATPIRRQVPVTDYLRLQARYAHLFRPEERTDVIARIQASADRNVSRFGLLIRRNRLSGTCAGRPPGSPPLPRKAVNRHGTALRHHAHARLEPGQPHRRMAHRAPRLHPRHAAVQRRVPGRREHPAVAVPRRRGRPRGVRDRVAADHGRQPVPRDHGPGLLPAVRDRVQPGPARRRPSGINSVERFLGDEAINGAAGKLPVAPAPTGKRVLVVGAGPSGLSAAYHLTRLGHSVTIKDAGAEPGGMMRYGIPKYRLPRDIMDAEIDRILDMGVTLELNTTVTDILAELTERPAATQGRGRLRRRLRGRRRAHRQARLHPGRRLGQDHGRGVAAAPDRRRLAADARPPGRRLRRREHRHGRRAHRAQARRGRGRRGLPPHQGPDARARHRGGGGAGGGRHDALAVHGRARRRRHAGDREDAARRDRVPAADRRVRGAGGGLPGARARPGRRPGRARRRARRDVLRRRPSTSART